MAALSPSFFISFLTTGHSSDTVRMGILIKCPCHHSTSFLIHNEFTDSTFIFILSPVCFLPISIPTVGGNFSILLFLALSSFPWAQDNTLCYRPLLMHHENSCNITGNSVQYVHLWAILSSKLATAIQMIAVWLHCMFHALPMGDSSATLPI